MLSLTPIKFATAFCVVPFAAQISFNRSFIARKYEQYTANVYSGKKKHTAAQKKTPSCFGGIACIRIFAPPKYTQQSKSQNQTKPPRMLKSRAPPSEKDTPNRTKRQSSTAGGYSEKGVLHLTTGRGESLNRSKDKKQMNRPPPPKGRKHTRQSRPAFLLPHTRHTHRP